MGCGLSKAHSHSEVLVSHASARTTFHGRLLMVQRHQAGWPKAHIAAAMGVSRKCVKTWIDRFASEGEAGLHDRSSRPHRTPTRTPAQVEERIVELRGGERRGPDWIGAELGVPARTVSRVLARHGVPRLASLDPITGEVIRASKVTAVRYERERPGELVHMDVKKLGRIPDGGGWRAHGRGMRTRDRKSTDPASTTSTPSSTTTPGWPTPRSCPTRRAPPAPRSWPGRSTTSPPTASPSIERLMTDNAWAYRYSLRELCAAAGIKQVFIRPHCPWQNGKVERLNRTLLTEWAYRQVFLTNDERSAALAPWLEHYNTQRRHSALGGLPPVSRLLPT